MSKLLATAKQRLLISSAIALMWTAAICVPSYANDSVSSDDVIELSVAEIDSTIQLIDELTLDVRLLEIDLREARSLSTMDSLLAAKQLDLTVQAYETMLQAYKDERDSWIQRIVKQPILWLAAGMWIGVQAQ